MRGKTVKRLRLMAYGLKRHEKEHESNDPRFREYKYTAKGTRINVGSRRLYQALKAEYKQWVRGGRIDKNVEPFQKTGSAILSDRLGR